MQQKMFLLNRLFLVSMIMTGYLLYSSASAYAGIDDINLTQPCSNADRIISVPKNIAQNISIGVVDSPGGNLAWELSSFPSGIGGTSCVAGPPVNCSDIQIELPAVAAVDSQVLITGMAVLGGGFQMDLDVTANGDTCSRFYNVNYLDPFQTVLVLDRSGSMTSTTNISAPATDRWDALKRSVNAMAPFFEASGTETASEIGVSFFNGDIVPNNSFSNTLETISNALPGQLDSELNSQSAAGATAMGKGIQSALAKLSDTTKPRTILLFTDGEQNVEPYIDLNGLYLNSTARSGCVAVSASCTEISPAIKIITIGIGQPSSDYLTTLQNLAWTHGGSYIITSGNESYAWDNNGAIVGVGDISAVFDNAIAPVLLGSSPQMVTSYKGQLVANNVVTLSEFKLNKYLSRLIIKFSYQRDMDSLMPLKNRIVIEKDGVDISNSFESTIQQGDYKNSFYLISNFVDSSNYYNPVTFNSAGSYVIKMQKPASVKNMGFKVAVYADDHLLDLNWKISPLTPKVGQSFKPQVTVKWKGSAIDSAIVNAWVLKPGGDLGQLLADYAKNIDPSSAVDAGTAGYQKYLAAINDPDFMAALSPLVEKLTLNYVADGKYQASYNPGNISGVYQIIYTVKVNGAETGDVFRTLMESVYVRFADIDMAASNVTTQSTANSTTIKLTPKSTVGFLIGPGQQNVFSFLGDDVNVKKITDYQNGKYRIELLGAPEKEITVSVLGDVIFTGAAKDFGKQAMHPWLKWLLWFILIVVLIWILVRFVFVSNHP